MFLDILYNLFVGPIEYIIEIVFGIGNRIAGNPGIAIIGVSLVINFLVLPLYKKSDALQEIEREKQKEMKPWLDHIKNNFKGDERYMMTQTYYRQQGYKPVYALRSSISLLLQIPFFIAAYHFLSNLELLQGASFLCFKNLGEPDQLIPFFFGIRLNLLPILMTAINVISGAIYTKGYPLKDKLQLYIVALVFLVVLYNSPSGLVFYWTLNNLFSLCKNIVMKGINLPERKKKPDPEPIDKKVFFLGTLFLTIFMGALIPLTTISSSPTEFISSYNTPLTLFAHTFSLYAGIFIVWFSVFYYLATPKGKNIFTYVVWLMSILFVVNYYFFPTDYGTVTPLLVYESIFRFPKIEQLASVIVLFVLAFASFFIIKKWNKIAKAVLTILVMACFGLSIRNFVVIQKEVSSAYEIDTDSTKVEPGDKIINLSEDGNNVVIIMLDRAVSEYFTKIIAEKPEIIESFSGFTFYPNTISLAACTNISTPSLFGGYEYTPTAINERADESLKDKHNEADTVLPIIFTNEGYSSTACDIPYVGNYKMAFDMSYYNQFGVEGYITNGTFTELTEKDYEYYRLAQRHNFVSYSFFNCVPTIAKGFVYNSGGYNSTLEKSGIHIKFSDAYSVLENLSNMTQINNDGNYFLMFQNETTHQPVFMNEEYEPEEELSTTINTTAQATYDVNMASILKLCDWFDYLKENDAYNNTRIIVCSDHSINLDDDSILTFSDKDMDLQQVNPLLLVKDFNSDSFTISDEFMTLADIPTIATQNIIENPVNPYTGNPINSNEKSSQEILITTSLNWDVSTNNGNVFDTSDGEWIKLTGHNIFDKNNWTKVSK